MNPINIIEEFQYRLTKNGNAYVLVKYVGNRLSIDLPCLYLGRPVVSIARYAFEKSSIQEIIIPYTYRYISDYAFTDSNIVKIIFKSSNIVSIGKRAFYNCALLSNIEIPNTVNHIGDLAFGNCLSLSSVEFKNNSKLVNFSMEFFSGCQSLTRINVPDSVSCIKNNTFNGWKSLKSIYLPNSVQDIEWQAFFDCTADIIFEDNSKLTELNDNALSGYKGASFMIPKSVTNLGEQNYHPFSGLTFSVIFESGSSLSYFSDELFWRFKGESITIPKSIKSIGYRTFYECSNLRNIVFEADSELEFIGAEAFALSSLLENISLPENVRRIDNEAFFCCGMLKNIIIPESVKRIGSSTFARCSNLNVERVDKKFDYLGKWLIDVDDDLISVDSLKSNTIGICDRAFFHLKDLEYLIIPNSVKYIGANLFDYQKTIVTFPEKIDFIETQSLSANCLASNLPYISSFSTNSFPFYSKIDDEFLDAQLKNFVFKIIRNEYEKTEAYRTNWRNYQVNIVKEAVFNDIQLIFKYYAYNTEDMRTDGEISGFEDAVYKFSITKNDITVLEFDFGGTQSIIHLNNAKNHPWSLNEIDEIIGEILMNEVVRTNIYMLLKSYFEFS